MWLAATPAACSSKGAAMYDKNPPSANAGNCVAAAPRPPSIGTAADMAQSLAAKAYDCLCAARELRTRLTGPQPEGGSCGEKQSEPNSLVSLLGRRHGDTAQFLNELQAVLRDLDQAL